MLVILISLETIGACVFCAVASVAVLLIFWKEVFRLEIYILSGKHNTGKTETLQGLIRFMCSNGYKPTALRGYGRGLRDLLNKGVALNVRKRNNLKDINVVLDDKKTNVIGITTFGDDLTRIINYLEIFNMCGCQKAVCAAQPQYISSLMEYAKQNGHRICQSHVLVKRIAGPTTGSMARCNQQDRDDMYAVLS